RAIDVVEQALGKVGGRGQILQSLLVLDADGVTTVFVGDTHSGDIHLTLSENLIVGKLGLRRGARNESDAFALEPLAYGERFGIGDAAHPGIERRLAEPLLEHSGGMQ